MDREKFVELEKDFEIPKCEFGCGRYVLRVYTLEKGNRVEVACSIDHIGRKSSYTYEEFEKIVEEQRKARAISAGAK